MNISAKWGLLVAAGLVAAVISSALAVGPPWWTIRGVLTTNPPNDYMAANQGQVKNIANKAFEEMNAMLDGGAGPTLSNLILNLSTSNAYDAINIGQLKTLAKPFYDRLIETGYTNAYPWSAATTDDQDFAAANIGQVKFVFGWNLDADNDGMPDWWETLHGLNNFLDDSGFDPDADFATNLEEYHQGQDPQVASDADGDGFSNIEEVTLMGTDLLNPNDGQGAIADTRQRIVSSWNMIFAAPLIFTNDPGSAADLQDLNNALISLSGKFYSQQ